MTRVALDLDRPAVVAGDQQALGDAADLHRRGVADRHARRAAGRAMGVGHQLLFRHADAAARAGQRQRRPHQPQKLAARMFVFGGGQSHFRRTKIGTVP